MIAWVGIKSTEHRAVEGSRETVGQIARELVFFKLCLQCLGRELDAW